MSTPTAEASPIRQVGAQVGRLWWIPLVVGLLSLGFGFAVLASDWSVKALVVFTGVVLVVRGVALALDPSYASDAAGEQVAAGVLGVVMGVVLIAWPAPTLLVLAVVAGLWMALSGAFRVVSCIARRRHMAQWGFGVAGGAVELLLGIWVMRRPEATLTLVITVLGLWLVLTGVVLCVQAFEIRSALRDVRRSTATRIDLRDQQTATAPSVPR